MMLDGLGQIVILNGPPRYRRKGMCRKMGNLIMALVVKPR
jgi:hypothetical protein